MGDSISEGGISDADPRNYIDKGYVGIIRNKLATKYGDVGKGMIPIYYPNGNPYWVTSGSWSIAAAVSGCTSRLLKTSSNGASVTINFNGTGIDVILVKGAILGQFNYTVDGGASTLFDCYQSGANYGAKLSITGLSSGDHTLVITKNNDGKEIWMIGHCEIKGTKGARVNLVGRWGTVVADSTPDGCLISEVDIWTPALTIIAFTANDYGNQTALATYQANLQTLIDRAKLYGDVLLTTIGLHSDTVGSIPQQSYFDTVKSLAIKNNCAYVDISGRWGGNTNVGTTGLLSDTVHPNAYGHQDIASAILKIIDEY
jgi:hypothetical protein